MDFNVNLFVQLTDHRIGEWLADRVDRAGLHDGVRHRGADQLRPRRSLHDGRVFRLHRDLALVSRRNQLRSSRSSVWHPRALVRDAFQRRNQLLHRPLCVPPVAECAQTRAAYLRQSDSVSFSTVGIYWKGPNPAFAPRALIPQIPNLQRAHRVVFISKPRFGFAHSIFGLRDHHPSAFPVDLVRLSDSYRQGDARHRAGSGCRGADGDRCQPHDWPGVPDRRCAGGCGRHDCPVLHQHGPVPDGFPLWALCAFTAAVLGGIGNLYGAVVGGLLIGIVWSLSDGFMKDHTSRLGCPVDPNRSSSACW